MDRLTSVSDLKRDDQGLKVDQTLNLSNIQNTLATTAGIEGQLNLPLSSIISQKQNFSSKNLSSLSIQKSHLKNTTGQLGIKDNNTYQINLSSFNDYNNTRNIESINPVAN